MASFPKGTKATLFEHCAEIGAGVTMSWERNSYTEVSVSDSGVEQRLIGPDPKDTITLALESVTSLYRSQIDDFFDTNRGRFGLFEIDMPAGFSQLTGCRFASDQLNWNTNPTNKRVSCNLSIGRELAQTQSLVANTFPNASRLPTESGRAWVTEISATDDGRNLAFSKRTNPKRQWAFEFTFIEKTAFDDLLSHFSYYHDFRRFPLVTTDGTRQVVYVSPLRIVFQPDTKFTVTARLREVD